MTKELSKKICEICGIEPKLNVSKSYLDKENIKDRYPDFGEPENFVKFLELKITPKTTIWGFISQGAVEISNREDFLKEVYILAYDYENFRNAIREAEWKYEENFEKDIYVLSKKE